MPARAAILATVAAALAGSVWLLRRRLAVVTVSGESMRPALASGDRVLVRRAALSQLQPGQVVVIEKPAGDGAWVTPPPAWSGGSREWLIKRVAALPGDAWPHLPWPATAAPSVPVTPTVPSGMFAVLGDNSRHSYDSRAFGYCPADRLLGIMVRPMHLPTR
jgi:signal peptidase I